MDKRNLDTWEKFVCLNVGEKFECWDPNDEWIIELSTIIQELWKYKKPLSRFLNDNDNGKDGVGIKF